MGKTHDAREERKLLVKDRLRLEVLLKQDEKKVQAATAFAAMKNSQATVADRARNEAVLKRAKNEKIATVNKVNKNKALVDAQTMKMKAAELELSRTKNTLKSLTKVVTSAEKKAEMNMKARYKAEKLKTATAIRTASLRKAVEATKNAPTQARKSVESLKTNKVRAVQSIAEAEEAVVRARMILVQAQMRAKSALEEEASLRVSTASTKRDVKKLESYRTETQKMAAAGSRSQQQADHGVVQADAAQEASAAQLAAFMKEKGEKLKEKKATPS